MSRLSRFLAIAVLGIALVPTVAHAQIVALPLGGFGNYGWPFFGGYPGFGGNPGFGGLGGFGGFGGMGYNPYLRGMANGYGGWGFYPPTYNIVSPVIYSVTTPSSGYQRDVPVEPRMRPAVWPAIPYRNAPRTETRATLDLHVPTVAAEVSLNGVTMQQTGIERHFVTPPLESGTYTFDVRVRWRDAAGKEMTRTRQIAVRPGERQTVDFQTGP